MSPSNSDRRWHVPPHPKARKDDEILDNIIRRSVGTDAPRQTVLVLPQPLLARGGRRPLGKLHARRNGSVSVQLPCCRKICLARLHDQDGGAQFS